MSDEIEDIELPVYDVPLTCRQCGGEFMGKSFVRRTADNPGYGICHTCEAIADAPKLPRKPDLDLRPPRRVFGEND